MADSKLQPLLDAAAKATPCPFCGHEGELGTWYVSDVVRYMYCQKCHASGPEEHEAHSLEAWNRRAPSSLELRLREYVGSLKKYGSNFTPMELSSPGVEARMSFAAAQVKQLEEILENKP